MFSESNHRPSTGEVDQALGAVAGATHVGSRWRRLNNLAPPFERHFCDVMHGRIPLSAHEAAARAALDTGMVQRVDKPDQLIMQAFHEACSHGI